MLICWKGTNIILFKTMSIAICPYITEPTTLSYKHIKRDRSGIITKCAMCLIQSVFFFGIYQDIYFSHQLESKLNCCTFSSRFGQIWVLPFETSLHSNSFRAVRAEDCIPSMRALANIYPYISESTTLRYKHIYMYRSKQVFQYSDPSHKNNCYAHPQGVFLRFKQCLIFLYHTRARVVYFSSYETQTGESSGPNSCCLTPQSAHPTLSPGPKVLVPTSHLTGLQQPIHLANVVHYFLILLSCLINALMRFDYMTRDPVHFEVSPLQVNKHMLR